MGIENLVLPEDAELAKSLRNKKENYIKNQFLLTRIASKKNVEGKTKEFYETYRSACLESPGLSRFLNPLLQAKLPISGLALSLMPHKKEKESFRSLRRESSG